MAVAPIARQLYQKLAERRLDLQGKIQQVGYDGLKLGLTKYYHVSMCQQLSATTRPLCRMELMAK